MIVVLVAVAVLAAWVGLVIAVRPRNPVHRLATPWEVELARLKMEAELLWREVGRVLVPVANRLAEAFRGVGRAAALQRPALERAGAAFAKLGEALRDESE